MRSRAIMAIFLLGLTLLVATGTPGYAVYDQAEGGVASPSALAAGGQTDYSVSLTGREAIVDVVLVLDNSGSMAGALGGVTKWQALSARSRAYVDSLDTSGLFTRGGRVGAVLFGSSATTAAAPTTDVTAIKDGINSGGPGTDGCIGCGIQRATDLLTAIPGAASHRQIVYVVADGANNVTPPELPDVVAASNAAHIERRAIGIGADAMSTGLESVDSNGAVPYPTDEPGIGQAYAADPTAYPGATNLLWTFHVTPGFTASTPTASAGAVTVTGQDVTWTLSGLGAQTATMSFHATHDRASGCGATSLLTGTTFSDAEGDTAPAAGLGALTLGGCSTSTPTPGDPTRSPTGIAALRRAFDARVVELTKLKLGTCARVYGTAKVKQGKLAVPAEGGKVPVFGVLGDGCRVVVKPTLRLPTRVHGKTRTSKVKLPTVKVRLAAGKARVVRVPFSKARARLVKANSKAKLSLAMSVDRPAARTVRRTAVLRLVSGK